MIVSLFLEVLFVVGEFIFEILNVPEIVLSDAAKESIMYVCDVLKSVLYFFPMDTVSAIVQIVFVFITFKITVTGVIKIWELIPWL